MFAHVVFYFAKPSNRQPAVEERLLRSGAGIFLREVRSEKLRESSDTFRFARSARRAFRHRRNTDARALHRGRKSLAVPPGQSSQDTLLPKPRGTDPRQRVPG